jgi:8-oxo-dGTP pyrophosphatase MutT (NUDIX family)
MEETAFQGQFVRVTTEKLGAITWERVYLPEGLVIFPITREGKIILIRERRPHETPPVRLKPVSGVSESHQTPFENALREMQEEIGFKGKLEKFWEYKTSGTVNSVTHFFIARDLEVSKLPNPDGDVIEEILEFTPEEIDAKVAQEEFRWGVSVMGWFKLKSLKII